MVVEPAFRVVDDVPGTEVRDESGVAGRGGRGDPCAQRGGDLYGERADATGAAVDEDMLAGLQAGSADQSLPGRERRSGTAAALRWPSPAGLAARTSAGTATYSAAAPSRRKGTSPYTSAPRAGAVTPAPCSTTTPDTSCAGTTGVRSRPDPSKLSVQVASQASSPAVMEAARTATTTSPGPGRGRGAVS
ncbi:hypothetical protein [Streptomyces sp. HYC2]|uniref:hypothetical protein n=1 Tax=Streptomyces sp. HYC2 TaxID=2955207 RepID=UPI00247FE4CF|nr:hypothetical protein [Streptomyces sp. HYC2]